MIYTFKTSRFREIDHTADIGLSGEESSLPALFASLAFGMLQIITKEQPQVNDVRRRIRLDEPSINDLLIRWLSDINYYLQVDHFLLSAISELEIVETPSTFYLQAWLHGSDREIPSDLIETEIKAVTYHQLAVTKRNNRYAARVIFDI